MISYVHVNLYIIITLIIKNLGHLVSMMCGIFRMEAYNPKMYGEWVKKGKAPSLPESLRLYRKLLSAGIKVVFLTGRPAFQRHVTSTNLKNAGFYTWHKLILRYLTNKNIILISSHRQYKLILFKYFSG